MWNYHMRLSFKYLWWCQMTNIGHYVYKKLPIMLCIWNCWGFFARANTLVLPTLIYISFGSSWGPSFWIESFWFVLLALFYCFSLSKSVHGSLMDLIVCLLTCASKIVSSFKYNFSPILNITLSFYITPVEFQKI